MYILYIYIYIIYIYIHLASLSLTPSCMLTFRMVALIIILAQAGSFVPAEFASISIYTNIFTRISNEDDMEANASTFSLEMQVGSSPTYIL